MSKNPSRSSFEPKIKHKSDSPLRSRKGRNPGSVHSQNSSKSKIKSASPVKVQQGKSGFADYVKEKLQTVTLSQEVKDLYINLQLKDQIKSPELSPERSFLPSIKEILAQE